MPGWELQVLENFLEIIAYSSTVTHVYFKPHPAVAPDEVE